MAAAAPWEAPAASGPLDATVRLPGSKSVAARALVLAASADGPSVLHGVPDARDTALMRAGLEALGAGFTREGESWRVVPAPLTAGATVDCGLAGTVLRFLPPLATLAPGTTRFTGDAAASRRPVAPLLAALAALGAGVSEPYRLPFSVTGAPRPCGGLVRLDASGSSQFVSGLLLAGARFDRGLHIVHTGERLPSGPHIEMTLAMLRARGVVASADDDRSWTVRPGPVAARDEWVEPDLTNTATFLAAALVAGGQVRAPWPVDSVQPGDALLAVLEAFGASVVYETTAHPGTVRLAHTTDATRPENQARGTVPTPTQEQNQHSSTGQRFVRVSGTGQIHAADLDLGEVSEFTPVAAALAALADGPSTISGVAHIRGHETDRLAALATELTALGAQVTESPDGLQITPRPLRPTRPFRSFGDHRMAHAAALLGLAAPGLQVDDIAVTTKTLPDFTGLWSAMVAQTSTVAGGRR